MTQGASGKHRQNNQIRVTAAVPRADSAQDAYARALARMAEMTRDKAYVRFAVVKVSDCGTMTMNGISVYHTCRLVGQMVEEEEQARPEGEHAITYFAVDDVLGARASTVAGVDTMLQRLGDASPRSAGLADADGG